MKLRQNTKRREQTRHRGIGRRAFLVGGLASSGLLLRSLATGLPPEFLINPARAQVPDGLPQTLVLATSSAGDPVNANCPGSYVANAQHPDAFAMPTPMTLGGRPTEAAAPWAALPLALRDRMAFVHHATRSPAHTDYRSTMGLHGSVRSTSTNAGDMFASMIAGLTTAVVAGTPNTTLQVEPLPLTGEDLTYGGRPLQTVAPSQLAALFAPPDGEVAPLLNLRPLRDQAIERVYRILREDGTAAQRSFVDRYIRSGEQARQLGEGLGAQLAALEFGEDVVDGAEHQLATAAILAAARVAPVMTVRIPFGGDNHQDSELTDETAQTTAGVAAIGDFWNGLVAAGIEDDVTFGLLNVFGRRLMRNTAGGRDHNRNHGVMIAFGPRVRGGVYGSVEVIAGAAQSQPIPAADGGEIAPENSLEAVGTSLGIALGHDPEAIGQQITGGQLIDGFIA